MTFHPYWAVLFLSFLAVGEWESVAKRRLLAAPEERRWLSHLAVFGAGFLTVWLIAPLSGVATALLVAESPFGLLNRPWLPAPLSWMLTVVLLDLSRYVVHYAHHRVPLLWRLHRVHHSDPDLDLSTGLRTHPFETLTHHALHLLTLACLAPPVGAVILAECLFGFQAFFSHANARLPERLGSALRQVFVTPDLHRIHHSDQPNEQDRNFGVLFPWWDRVFRTYLAEPALGQAALVPGLRGFQTRRSLHPWFMLSFPFARAGALMRPADTSARQGQG